MKKNLRVFTSVWDEKHLQWFEKYCLRSLKWEENAAALEDCTWTFLTKKDDQPKVSELLEKSGLKITRKNFLILPDEFNPHAGGAYINQGLLQEMQACLSENAQMLLAPPDTIFGNGSIRAMREVGRQRDSVVFAVHARVLPEIETPNDCSNAQLVSCAWNYLHKTWEHAQDSLEKINSYIGGVSWKWIGENLYAVTHRLPTPYLINWTPEDIVYFKNQIHWGVIDHSWPHECLIHTERMRLLGSSDAAFMVEITEADKNIPPTAAYHGDEPDLFWRNLSHNKTNRMFSVILRGES